MLIVRASELMLTLMTLRRGHCGVVIGDECKDGTSIGDNLNERDNMDIDIKAWASIINLKLIREMIVQETTRK
jgi:hypothetical protein